MSDSAAAPRRPSWFLTFLRQPPLALEIVLWVLLAIFIAGMRIYAWHLLPAYLWSRDAGSYCDAAFHWLDTGTMIFDGRRGPVYTLLIATALKLFGSMNGVVWLQQGLGGVAVMAIVLAARVWWGRICFFPLFVCGACLAAYGLPLHLGHLIRNESVLFVLSAAAFSSWWLALKWNSRTWLFVAALSAGILTMTKNVFVPFPFALLGGVLFFEGHARNAKLTRIVLIIAGFLFPFAALKVHNALATHVAPPEPQSGILFYGRTAQWTKLDGGIEPELKAMIRAEVEEYKARPKLDNNIVIKRTIVPHLWRELQKQGKTAVDLDRLCRRFAFEAVQSQPKAFWQQACSDLYKLNFHDGVSDEFPNPDEAGDGINELRHRDEPPHPTMENDRTLAILASHQDQEPNRLFHRILARSILFQFYPVFETTIALVLLLLVTRGREREFFLGAASVWYFNMVLLCTVGRPVERYLMPLVPIMFWALSGLILFLWRAVLRPRDTAEESSAPLAEKTETASS